MGGWFAQMAFVTIFSPLAISDIILLHPILFLSFYFLNISEAYQVSSLQTNNTMFKLEKSARPDVQFIASQSHDQNLQGVSRVNLYCAWLWVMFGDALRGP